MGDSARITPTAERSESPDLFFACGGRAGVLTLLMLSKKMVVQPPERFFADVGYTKPMSKIDGGSTQPLTFGVILFIFVEGSATLCGTPL